MAGLLLGLGFTLIYIINFTPSLGGTGAPADLFLGISTTCIGTVGMVINFVVAFAVSRLTPAPSQHV
ncbi:hypothetical protein [Deinococcus sp. AJ005]|uniref:hypothetical protein n=1 Tax=Deinococcus sp. AJ005 TaxID=2652443 RepID=UPI00125CAB57|nr:hypothetical protein [Deinococcus sp. AJ005]QFP77842.1 hypothetical protein DAAJ005_16335 [Deinococcus sp. AJ005]